MIFVSHAREDAVFASALAATLAAEGQAVLIDPPRLQGDAFWRQRLARQLEDCDTMIAVESPAAAASPWVQQERQGFRGPRRSVAATPAAGARPAPPLAAERTALAARQHAWLQALLARPAPRAEFAGDRAWLAGGRIELRRVPGGAFVATAPLTNTLYREFVAAMRGEVPPPPTWTDPEFAAAFAADALSATAMTWFEAAACAHRFGGALPGEDHRRAVGDAASTWDWCADGWQPGDPSPLAHRVIVGGSGRVERYRNAPIDRDCCVGLRLALPPPER